MITWCLFCGRSPRPGLSDGFLRLRLDRIATSDRKVAGAPIWRYTGTPCTGDNCPGWQRLDNNPKTVAIVATGTHHDQVLYQLHNDGWIWRLPAVHAWEIRARDGNDSIAIQRQQLLPLRGANFTSFTPMGGSGVTPAAMCAETIARDGSVWTETQRQWRSPPQAINSINCITTVAVWRYTGTPCAGENCSGWQRLDNNAKTVSIAAGGEQSLSASQ